MTRHGPAVTAAFTLEQHSEVARLLHLRDLLSRGHPHVVARDLPRPVDESVLPRRTKVLRTLRLDDSRHVLAEHRGMLILLESYPYGATVVVSGRSESAAAALADDVRSRVPQADDDARCEVSFSDSESGSRYVRLALRSWEQSRPHYAADVQRALDALVAHQPDVDVARRLLLWHGPPGTGKTSAVRALMHAWRGWAHPVVVTDPEVLLSDGVYLRRLLLDHDEEDGRWQLLVLEDAEALLRKDTGGPAMSRLLNLTDGLLGQGMRCLFLITTNEPLAAVHPAVVRPGRCLAQVQFGPLPAGQSAALLGRPVDRPMTLAEALGAEPVSAVEATARVGQYL